MRHPSKSKLENLSAAGIETWRLLPFVDAILPWKTGAAERLQEKAGKQLQRLSSEALFTLQISLVKRWSHISASSLLTEMWIWMQREDFLFQGADSRERYLNFVKKKCWDPQWLSNFFEEYEELRRLMSTELLLWEEQTILFLQRLDADLSCLAKTFNEGKPLGQVTALTPDAGDRHLGGRSVCIVTFACGKRVVYKPKSLKIVEAFGSLIALLEIDPPLKRYAVLCRENYGWEEAVEHKPCHDLEEVKRYFERSGMLVCLMYLLGGTDVHFENIIASGQHPFLIDLETLFHSQLRRRKKKNHSNLMDYSVLSSGLLPQFILGKKGEKGEDVSGLGMGEAQTTTLYQYENVNTSEMCLVKKTVPLTHSSHQVLLEGQVIRAQDHVDDIVLGFRKMYTLISNQKPFFQQQISQMAEHPVRIILRPTRFYAYLLSNLHTAPIILNRKYREEELKILKKYSGMGKKFSSIEAEEVASLLQGDIPCFHTRPSSSDLFCEERLIAKDCLDNSALKKTSARLQKMNERDRDLQEALIRQAFYAKTHALHDQDKKKTIFAPLSVPDDNEIMNWAKTIAADLRKNAFELEGGALGWIHLEPNFDQERYELLAMGDSLYSGRAGIALFFASLSHLSGSSKWREEALKALSTVRKRLHREKTKRLLSEWGLGGMIGAGGIGYTLFQIGRLLDLTSLIEEAKKLFFAIGEEQIRKDSSHDILFGSAGLILALLSFHRHFPDKQILQIAEKCGEHLCRKAKKMKDGSLAWKSTEGKPLLGFSHGTAGIVYALLKLADATKNQNLLDIAQRALAYERSFFSTEHQNWPLFGDPISYPSAWCNGATGIGFARLASLPFFSNAEVLREIEIAVETTKKHLHAASPNLCCGSLGRLEFLRAASSEIDPQTTGAILHTIRQSQLDLYHPGFMQGAAGIGYTLLRLLDQKKQLPQVLLLD